MSYEHRTVIAPTPYPTTEYHLVQYLPRCLRAVSTCMCSRPWCNRSPISECFDCSNWPGYPASVSDSGKPWKTHSQDICVNDEAHGNTWYVSLTPMIVYRRPSVRMGEREIRLKLVQSSRVHATHRPRRVWCVWSVLPRCFEACHSNIAWRDGWQMLANSIVMYCL